MAKENHNEIITSVITRFESVYDDPDENEYLNLTEIDAEFLDDQDYRDNNNLDGKWYLS